MTGVRRATRIFSRGTWRGEPADQVTLDFDARHRRRIAMDGEKGARFLLDLPEAVALRGGDALLLDDGGLVEVVAAPEPLCELRAASPRDFARLAWHLGNRHLPVQFLGAAARIRVDRVVEEMARGLGATATRFEAPFDPEAESTYPHAHGRTRGV